MVNVTSTITVVLVAQRVCEHERIEPIVFDRGDFVALPRLGGDPRRDRDDLVTAVLEMGSVALSERK